MYIFKPHSSDGVDEKLSKPSPGVSAPLADGLSARVLIAPVVPAQRAHLAGVSGSGLALTSIVDAIVTAGIVSNAALPLTSEYAPHAANENSVNILAGALEAFSKNALNNLGVANFAAVPITSLSDSPAAGELSIAPHRLSDASVPMSGGLVSAMGTIGSGPVLPNLPVIVDVSAAPLPNAPLPNAPVVISALTDNDITVTSNSNSDVHLNNFTQQAAVQNYINTGAGTLSVITSGTQLSSLSLTGNVAFSALADEVTSGITVSALHNSSDVTLYLVGGASAKQGSSDVITLGNGNNFVLDAGDGQVTLNFGSGTNVVMLTGVGVNGQVHFAQHTDSVGDFVTIAANGASSAAQLAQTSIVTISGLNNREHSLDTITFLGDMGANLSWSARSDASAGANASNAQVMTALGDATQLQSWVGAAQAQASHAHSVAWFQFDGNTYVLESATGNAGNHLGDTLVRLTGLTQFTGDNGELAFSTLHLAG
jgi:hypothetical protein